MSTVNVDEQILDEGHDSASEEATHAPEPPDYVFITDGSCHVAHVQAFANGTQVLTIKGREPRP